MEAKTSNSLEEFLLRNQGKPMAIVTSGGTSAPLEKNTVRSIENFSTGTRGAKSVEQFLKYGFVVIFMTRAKSQQPFRTKLDIDQ